MYDHMAEQVAREKQFEQDETFVAERERALKQLDSIARAIQSEVGNSSLRVKAISMRLSADGSALVSVTSTATRYFGRPKS